MVQNGSKLPIVKPTSNPEAIQPNKKPLSRKHEMVAQLAARGLDTNNIAEQVRLSPKRVREILRTEEVGSEINRIVAERFQEADRLLPSLYQKALAKLDQHLDNPSVEVQARAVEKALKFHEPKDERGRPMINQFFAGGHGPEEKQESLDEIILRKRRERGLPVD